MINMHNIENMKEKNYGSELCISVIESESINVSMYMKNITNISEIKTFVNSNDLYEYIVSNNSNS